MSAGQRDHQRFPSNKHVNLFLKTSNERFEIGGGDNME